ncbi:cutinase family protein [Nocardia wallacei]|uniref:cutinase family protein n=1 Tax=Nocardia wallacei TaxID=480035 RepID=UPI00245600DD|nr:cutinase family protein [Nocardia wallacei]
MNRTRKVSSTAALGTAAVMAAMMNTTSVAAAEQSVPLPDDCPALVVLGVQGTGESSPIADPMAQTGMLGSVLGPITASGGDVQRILVPYEASFGGIIGTGPETAPFAESAAQATARLDATAAGVAAHCPDSMLAVTGYSQGAGVVSDFARRVGAGEGPVPTDRIAGVAVLADWTRPPGGEVFPGRPGQRSPDAPPGTDGTATSEVTFAPVPSSGGIASDTKTFGDLTGRVAQVCIGGDLSCDAPANAAVLRVAAGVAARTDFRDPLSAAASAGAAWSATVEAAVTHVLLNDVRVGAGGVNYAPRATVSERMADAAVSPHAAPTPQESQAAADVAEQVAAAVAADPLGQIPRIAGQVVAAVAPNAAVNSDVVNPAVLARYSDVIARHTGYNTQPQVAQWLDAMSRDLTGGPR